MGRTFDQDDVFPIIARLIEARHAQHVGFVTSRELADALIQDNEGRRAVEEAHRRRGGSRSREWIASNMVAWFGQRITIGKSDWAEKFDREKVNRRWAYKPALPAAR